MNFFVININYKFYKKKCLLKKHMKEDKNKVKENKRYYKLNNVYIKLVVLKIIK